MTKKQLKKIMLNDIGDVKYWLYCLMEELEKDDIDIRQLNRLTSNIVDYTIQFNKYAVAFEMLESLKKENEK